MTRQLSDGDDTGQILGQSATDKVAFFGGTPVVQQAAIADATDAATAITQLNDVIAALEAYGLLATS
jgi:hypothetical protein